MKKIIIGLIVLLFIVPATANQNLLSVIARKKAIATTCDSCTGALVSSVHFNGTTDITNGTPCGCSTLGDTVVTLNGDATITGGYLNTVDGEDYSELDISDCPLDGSMLIAFEVPTYYANTRLVRLYYDATNNIGVYLPSTADIAISWRGTGVLTLNDLYSTSTKYYLVVRWTNDDVDPNFYIELFNEAGTSLGSATSNTNPSTMLSTPNKLQDGNVNAAAGAVKIYFRKLYNTYAGAPSSSFPAIN